MAKPVKVEAVKEVKSRVDSYSNGRSQSLGIPPGGILARVMTRSQEYVKFECFPFDGSAELSTILVKASLCDELGTERAFERHTGKNKCEIVSCSEDAVFDVNGLPIAA